ALALLAEVVPARATEAAAPAHECGGLGHDTIADSPALDILADGRDLARRLVPEHDRRSRAPALAIAPHVNVGAADSDCPGGDEHRPGCQLRLGEISYL